MFDAGALQITFRFMDSSAALETRIRQRPKELDAGDGAVEAAHGTMSCRISALGS
jgi:hypothetical protein